MKIFPTAQDAEHAFYEALERCDLEGMMAVWAEDDDIVCIHPAGARLSGQEQVRESWTQIFAGGPRARVAVSQQLALGGTMFAVHSVFENFTLLQAPRGPRLEDARPAPIVATNVYQRTAAGWRMIVHHAAPAPAQPEPAPREGPPKIIH